MDGARIWLAYARTKGVNRRRLRALMEFFPAPQEAWQASAASLACLPGWNLLVADAILSGRPEGLRIAEAELARAETAGLRLVTMSSPAYPDLLREIPDPPPLFYVGGDAPLTHPSVAIVGTRKPTPYGLAVAERWGYELARSGLTVVSGMASGVDSAAHRGALEGGRSVAVLGSGADVAYPQGARRLHRALLERGAVISEYPPGTKPMPFHFPERNRIISGLSLGIIVVEAGDRSGTLITVGCALEQGRDVFAVPGPVTSPMSVGAHRLIREGAVLVTSPDDVLQELTARWPHLSLVSAGTQLAVSESEQRLLAAMGDGPVSAEDVAQVSGMKAPEVQALLSVLELKAIVHQITGGLYIRRS